MKCPNCYIDLKITDLEGQMLQVCPKCWFNVPKNHLKVDNMYAYLSVDQEDGNEGLVAIDTATGKMPLVGADMGRMLSYKPIVKNLVKTTGFKVRLYKFSSKKLLDEINP